MNVLHYTVACGIGMKEIVEAIPCCVDRHVITDDMLGMKDLDAYESYKSRSRVREFFDINQYDAVCFTEADVEIRSTKSLTGEKILVEKGDLEFREFKYKNPTGKWPLPKAVTPWNGVIYVPKSQYKFFDSWSYYYKTYYEHKVEELVLWHALQKYPWDFLQTTRFYPFHKLPQAEKDIVEFVHYRGVQAKQEVCNTYQKRFLSGLLNNVDYYNRFKKKYAT